MAILIPKASLKKWAQLRFREHQTTVDLMASTNNAIDRTAIAIVALLEVDSTLRYLGMRDDEVRYIKSCHRYLNSIALKPDPHRRYSAH